MKRFLIALCLLCSLVASTPTRADFVPSTPAQAVPSDHYVDSHNQICPILNEFAGSTNVKPLLISWGWDQTPIDAEDCVYLRTHRSGAPRSLYTHLVAQLFADKLIGQGSPEPVDPTSYPGKPTYSQVLDRLEGYGLALKTGSGAERDFFVTRYYQNKLTIANDEAWMAKERGLYWLPETHEVGLEIRGLYVQLEKAIARWGLSGLESDRAEAYGRYFAFESAAIPGPGTPASAPGTGRLIINPRRVFNAGRRIENAIVQGRASDAAKNGTRVAWLLGDQSLYEQYAMQTYPLSENDWRAALGLPLNFGQGPGFFIGGQGSN